LELQIIRGYKKKGQCRLNKNMMGRSAALHAREMLTISFSIEKKDYRRVRAFADSNRFRMSFSRVAGLALKRGLPLLRKEIGK
jgi:hypothetical protein